MEMTRRELGMAAVGLAVGTDAEAQAPAAPDPAQAVRDGNKRNSDALTKFEIPIATEPAFRFEA
jgi:hypothetical protein